MIATRSNQLGAMRVVLATGINPNYQSKTGYTAFFAAARGMGVDAITMLLEAGADPKLAAYDQETVIRGAIIRGHLGVVKALLEAGCPPDTRDGSQAS